MRLLSASRIQDLVKNPTGISKPNELEANDNSLPPITVSRELDAWACERMGGLGMLQVDAREYRGMQ